MKRHYLLNEVAQLVGTLPHRIAYAITNRHLPEPEERLNNHRLFTEADIMRIKMYFDHKRSKAKREAKG
jgi:DNA-binding transcriptional MerR regulator